MGIDEYLEGYNIEFFKEVESFEEATFLLQAVIVSKIIMETRQF
jgi:hypothetical protein